MLEYLFIYIHTCDYSLMYYNLHNQSIDHFDDNQFILHIYKLLGFDMTGCDNTNTADSLYL